MITKMSLGEQRDPLLHDGVGGERVRVERRVLLRLDLLRLYSYGLYSSGPI